MVKLIGVITYSLTWCGKTKDMKYPSRVASLLFLTFAGALVLAVATMRPISQPNRFSLSKAAGPLSLNAPTTDTRGTNRAGEQIWARDLFRGAPRKRLSPERQRLEDRFFQSLRDLQDSYETGDLVLIKARLDEVFEATIASDRSIIPCNFLSLGVVLNDPRVEQIRAQEQPHSTDQPSLCSLTWFSEPTAVTRQKLLETVFGDIKIVDDTSPLSVQEAKDVALIKALDDVGCAPKLALEVLPRVRSARFSTLAKIYTIGAHMRLGQFDEVLAMSRPLLGHSNRYIKSIARHYVNEAEFQKVLPIYFVEASIAPAGFFPGQALKVPQENRQ